MSVGIVNSVEVQRVFDEPGSPASDLIQKWAGTVLDQFVEHSESVIRMVGADESAALNREYRKKEGPTNVLSFSYGTIGGQPVNLLGDVVICVPLVAAEALEQSKSLEAHWAHLVVHGLLHLLGYDHQEQPDALEMEAMELKFLTGFGYPDPYQLEIDQ